jgi:uncharacterized protein YggU (UPF0235/DUF167 family)
MKPEMQNEEPQILEVQVTSESDSDVVEVEKSNEVKVDIGRCPVR